jgi:hypothetical protein
MPYVSEELLHFVGRSLPSDGERYSLVRRIISGGILLDPFHLGKRYTIFKVVSEDPETGAPDGVEYSSYPSAWHDPGAKLSDNAMMRFEMVCFCDIPLSDLNIHCSKYGRFGLAFERDFLIKQGASPVMYVPHPGTFNMIIREHQTSTGELQLEEAKTASRADMMDEVFKYHNIKLSSRWSESLAEEVFLAFRDNSKERYVEAIRQLRTLIIYQTAIESLVFSHLKFFDHTLPSDDPANYYMEREWRVSGKVSFALSDIKRVFVAAGFGEPARRDLPELAGCITELN